MQRPLNPSSGRNSGHGLRRRPVQSANLGAAGASLGSTEGGGTGAMPFSNRISTGSEPSIGTASSSSSQITGDQNVQVNSNSFADLLSLGGGTQNTRYMNNDNLGINPRYLTISPSDPRYRRHTRPEHEDDNVPSTSVPPRVSNLPSPLDFTFQGSPVNSLSPTTLPPPSSAGSSYSNDVPNQLVYSPLSVRQPAVIDEYYWQQQSNESAQFFPRDDMAGFTGYMPYNPPSAFGDDRASFNTGLPIAPQGMGSVVHSDQPVISGSTEQSEGTSNIVNQNPGAPIASSSSSTIGVSTSEFTTRPGPTSPERPVKRQKSQKKMASRIQISTGYGPQDRMNMSMPDWSPGASSSSTLNLPSLPGQQAMTSCFEGIPGSCRMQTRSAGKGKGKLVLHEQSKAHATTKGSSSSKKKGEDNVKLPTMKPKPVRRRPQPTRPLHIDCPFADCAQTIPNMEGSIRQHVESCSSSQVKAVRESERGKHYVICPTCRRKFMTLERWAKHLFEVHGEWKLFPCEVEGCDAIFLFEKDRNEHMRNDH